MSLGHAKIALITLWTGKWPNWISLFVESCRRNPSVTWMFFCEESPPGNVPDNLKVYQIGLEGIRSLIRDKLGDAVAHVSGYKFCDLKPAYGKVFEDYINNFDFFGFCDCDIFWGSFDRHFDGNWLQQYDIITSQRMTICGQMTLFRNSDRFRTIFVCIERYLERLADAKYQGLDELVLDEACLRLERNEGIRVLRRQMQFHDETYDPWYVRACALEMEEKGHIKDLGWVEGPIRWDDGRVFNIESGKECLFFHFMYWKNVWSLPNILYDTRFVKGWEVRRSGVRLIYSWPMSFSGILYCLSFESRRSLLSLALRLGLIGKRGLLFRLRRKLGRFIEVWGRSRSGLSVSLCRFSRRSSE